MAAVRKTTKAITFGRYPCTNGSTATAGASAMRATVRRLGSVQTIAPLS
jgi:hypothetical protein